MAEWLAPFQTPWDVAGFILFLLIFPLYHTLYPWLSRKAKSTSARNRVDIFRESWIERIIAKGDAVGAAQQTRNLTMVSSILVSSCLIFMGLSVNLLFRLPEINPHPPDWNLHPDAVRMKLFGLILLFALAFSFFMTALRHLGHFVLVIGADPKVIEENVGSPVQYFSGLINRASHRYTLGVRSLYAALPWAAWILDSRLFVLITLFWGIKLVAFQDFNRESSRR